VKNYINQTRAKLSLVCLTVSELIEGNLGIRRLVELWKIKSEDLGLVMTEKHRSLPPDQEPMVVIVIHVFYEEYLAEVSKVLKSGAHLSNIYFLISTSKSELVSRLEGLVSDTRAKGRVALVPNVGRNFAPLFVEFSQEIQNFDVLLALHSKLSKHTKQNLGRIWADRAWKLLGSDEKLLVRVLDLFKIDKGLGLVYPYTKDFVRPINLTWGNNLQHLTKLRKIYKTIQMKELLREIDFPVGGMFAARVEAILPMLQEEWTYDLFPEELGQIDGTLQHAIERAIGLICTEAGYTHAQYVNAVGSFYKLNQSNFDTKSGSN
jgi:lipopolysaccharide biosynthesis protein